MDRVEIRESHPINRVRPVGVSEPNLSDVIKDSFWAEFTEEDLSPETAVPELPPGLESALTKLPRPDELVSNAGQNGASLPHHSFAASPSSSAGRNSPGMGVVAPENMVLGSNSGKDTPQLSLESNPVKRTPVSAALQVALGRPERAAQPETVGRQNQVGNTLEVANPTQTWASPPNRSLITNQVFGNDENIQASNERFQVKGSDGFLPQKYLLLPGIEPSRSFDVGEFVSAKNEISSRKQASRQALAATTATQDIEGHWTIEKPKSSNFATTEIDLTPKKYPENAVDGYSSHNRGAPPKAFYETSLQGEFQRRDVAAPMVNTPIVENVDVENLETNFKSHSDVSNAQTMNARVWSQASAGQPTPVPVANQIVVELLREGATGKAQEYEIRLDPEELGKVKININVNPRDGGLIISFTAERQETLDMLRRHSEELLDGLAGSDFNDASLEFSRGETADDQGQAHSNSQYEPESTEIHTSTATPIVNLLENDRLDIRL